MSFLLILLGNAAEMEETGGNDFSVIAQMHQVYTYRWIELRFSIIERNGTQKSIRMNESVLETFIINHTKGDKRYLYISSACIDFG